MPDDRPTVGAEPSSPELSRSYVRVLVIEVLVLAALYGFGRYFG